MPNPPPRKLCLHGRASLSNRGSQLRFTDISVATYFFKVGQIVAILAVCRKHTYTERNEGFFFTAIGT